MSPSLRAAVYVSPATPWHKPNGTIGGPWSPISSTLIYSDRSACLVDTPITVAQTTALADWISDILGPTRRLTTIYITHGHADHWLGINLLRHRFPDIHHVFATRGTIAHMKQQQHPPTFAATWASQFPNGQLDATLPLDVDAVMTALPSSGGFQLDNGDENYKLQAIEVGHTDTHDSTILWVPDLKLAVCGDVVYGDVHMMLAAANTPALRGEWIAAIEAVEALKPEMVVAGHKRPGEMDGVFHLQASKRYIEDFGRLVEEESQNVTNARELGKRMMELYPTRFNQGALLAGCISAFKAKNKGKGGKL